MWGRGGGGGDEGGGAWISEFFYTNNPNLKKILFSGGEGVYSESKLKKNIYIFFWGGGVEGIQI